MGLALVLKPDWAAKSLEISLGIPLLHRGALRLQILTLLCLVFVCILVTRTQVVKLHHSTLIPTEHLSSLMREFSRVFVFAYTFEGISLENIKVARIFQSIAQWEGAPN